MTSGSDLGPQLASAQLRSLERVSGGALEVVSEAPGSGSFMVSLDTSGIEVGLGIRVRQRERFRIRVGDRFPFTSPTVWASHRRWAGTPHVQWGSQLCLYAAESVEWNPADGMRGFVGRLVSWLENAAAGTLDPDGQPLHPPPAYVDWNAGMAVVCADLGSKVPWARAPDADGTETGTDSTAEPGEGPASRRASGVDVALGWCVRDGSRVEVLEWMSRSEALSRAIDKDVRFVDGRGREIFLVPAVLVDGQISWEYPTGAEELLTRLGELGVDRGWLLDLFVFTARMNRFIRLAQHLASDAGTDLNGDPLIVALGTPSRRVGGTQRLAHIVMWRLDQFGTQVTDLLRRIQQIEEPSDDLVEQMRDLIRVWAQDAEIAWMRVHELRPEVTQRRDLDTPASWLIGKRVLVVGCGALGAPIAEFCARAGAASLVLLDNGVVNPGILVRQPYYDFELGSAKSAALRTRLNAMMRNDIAQSLIVDATDWFLKGEFNPGQFDLVVDASADSGTRAVIERSRTARQDDWPPVVCTVIGHEASRGLVTVSTPGSSASGHDLLRRVALRGRYGESKAWTTTVDDLFPNPPRTSLFLPEPGCSSPTFIGSATDVTSLAAQMLTAALRDLTTNFSRMSAHAVAVSGGSPSVVRWDPDLCVADIAEGFEVRISARAAAEMRAEVRRGARARGDGVETGGMLLGAIDDATRVIHVDLATGPSPDSRLSPYYFDHGTQGTQELIDAHQERSGGMTGFLGIWHSHPGGPARPSPIDEAGMAAITTFTGTARRALMVILGGEPDEWRRWREGHLDCEIAPQDPPQVYARLVNANPTATPIARTSSTRTQAPPPSGPSMPGGFSDASLRRGTGLEPDRGQCGWPTRLLRRLGASDG